MFRIDTLRRWSLIAAEAFDAWRVVPRTILVAYGWMVWNVTRWYMSIPSSNQIQCQADVLRVLMESKINIDQARAMACSIVDTIGGPTSEQTMFVSIVTGLSSVVIGLYLNTGKTSKWQGDVIPTINPSNPLANDSNYGNSDGYRGGFMDRMRRRRTSRWGSGSFNQPPTTIVPDSDLPMNGDETPLDEDVPPTTSTGLDPDPVDQG